MRVRAKLLMAGGDILLAALIVLLVWVTGYRLPQQGIKAGILANQMGQENSVSSAGKTTESDGTGLTSADQILEAFKETDIANLPETDASQLISSSGSSGLTGSTDSPAQTAAAFLQKTGVVLSTEDWRAKFADKFTSQVISTQDSYTSPNLSIQITRHSFDSGKLDTSEAGKHKKYGTKVAYVLADIYIGDITCLQTAFAKDTYGVGYEEKLSSMSDRIGSILAVNGDSYSNNRHKDNGTIIRNGVIYRSQQSTAETCVLNWDGTMKVYDPGMVDVNQLIKDGAYQSWIFGPSLLDDNGKAKTSFQTWDYIRESHPRTAIGYYEPGHYCLLLVDGRQADYSRGMFPEEMAAVFEQLGCKLAYNLDGGHCSFMTFQGGTANHPYKPDHTVQDGIFLTEGLAASGN